MATKGTARRVGNPTLVLRAVAETFVPGGESVRLAEHLAETIAALPHRADRSDVARLLRLLESPLANVLLGGVPRAFFRMSLPQREGYLRRWATSRLPIRRKAFQALKRMATIVYYTSRDPAGRANPSWPRLGYPGPLGAPPAVAKRITPLEIAGDATLHCDVVIVGSGAGGGVVAGELAARGLDVVVLEKGGHYDAGDFTHYEGEMLSRLYDAGGLLTSEDLGLVILQGSCLGGGTVVNYATSFRTPGSVREQWSREHGLPHFTTSEFTRALDAVSHRLGVTTDQSRPGARDQVLLDGLEALDWHRAPLPRDVRGCPQDDECGYCGYGCRREAKQSTLVTYLRDAFERGARIVVGARVRRVRTAQGRAAGVEAFVHHPQGARPYTLTVHAKAVVVAAGAVHAPALLRRSGVRLPALGNHLALHPATAVFGLMDHETHPWTGTLQSHYSDQFADLDGGYGFRFETAPLHPSLFALGVPWESATQHAEVMTRLARTALVGVLLRDRDGGTVRLDGDGHAVVSHRLSPYDTRHLRRGLVEAARVLEAAGAREIWSTHSRWTAYRPDATGAARARWLEAMDRCGYGPNQLLLSSFHQMASCRMGTSPAASVVNPEHEVWGVPGLAVADASTFPSSSGVNPMLTIMAIAHRAAAAVASKV
jgi:choline dehydrogenase-like flavoprotein